MNTVRTTITLDASLHRQLSLQAMMLGVVFSDLINRKLVNKNVGALSDNAQQNIAKNRTLFRALGRKVGKTDWTKLVRNERKRDNG